MRRDKKSTLKFLTIAVGLFLFLFLLPAPAQAEGWCNWIGSPLDCTLNTFTSLVAVLIAWVGSGVDKVFDIPVANQAVVANAWNLVRGFSNMFFILALIIMAFATIFDISKYEFRTLIARFLIAALLINFSLVIGEIIIDWSTSLSNVFLQAIGPVGTRIAERSDIAFNFDSKSLGSAATVLDQEGWLATMNNFLSIILMGIVLFSLMVLLFFAIIRVPILWALLIISPIAWITYILPTTMAINRQWWKNFIAWNLFAPIYLFFIYFGVLFMDPTNQNNIVGSFAGSVSGLNATFQILFFNILVAIFLIGGAKIAMTSSMTAGAGGVAAGIWAKSKATTRFAGSRIPLVPYRQRGGKWYQGWRMADSRAIAGGYKEAKQHYGKEGVFGFGGSRKGEEKAGAFAGSVLGVPGMSEENLRRNVDAEVKAMKEKGLHLKRGELEGKINNGSPEERIAAAQLFAEENYGALSPEQVSGIRKAFGSNVNTTLAASTFRKIKWDEIPAENLREFLDTTNPNYINDPNGNIQSLIYAALIDKGRANEGEIQEALRLARSGQQKGNIVKKSKEFLGKSLTGGQRQALLTGLGTAPENNEARIELLKIMAEESDTFFHNAAGDPDNNQLTNYAQLFGNIGDRKKFLENVAKKDADSAAMVMLDDAEIRLRDDAGNEITRATHADAEELVLRQTIRKLSVEDKLSQHRGQYNSANFQQELARDMAKNSSSLQDYLKNDKYASARTYIGGAGQAEEQARNAIFARQYLQPFQLALGRANNLLRAMGPRTYTSRTALDQDIRQVRDELGDLKKIRSNYEDLYRYNNILSPGGQLDPNTQAQITNFDTAIQLLNTRLTRLADSKRTRNP